MSVKAFELVPAIERLKLLGDRSKTSIECIECCGKNLYIGTSDCFVYHYLLEERTQPNGKIMYTSEKQSQKHLALKKPVQQLSAASALTRILVLCDNTLTLLNMFNLEPILSGAKIKGVTAFCVNQNPSTSNPFSIEIAVATRKRLVQVYSVTEDKMVPMRDVSIPDMPVNLEMDGSCVCVAMTMQYTLANKNTGELTDLFPYESEQSVPLVKRVGKEEFLLSGPGALGMFVTSAGISQRPPLRWSETVCGVSYMFPYIVALDDEFLTVHSVLDQQQKQTIPFQGGKILGDFEGKIFVASSKEVYGLVPLPVDKQVQALLNDKRVEEAIILAKNFRKIGTTKEQYTRMMIRIQQQSGFIELGDFHFEEAGQLFRDGQLDVRELISLFPNLLPSTSNFTRSIPPLHEYADISQVHRGDVVKLGECKKFLVQYLEQIRDTDLSLGNRAEIDTCLMKLYAESYPEQLVDLVSNENWCLLPDGIDVLERHKRYHVLGLLYRYHTDNDKALQLWARIVDGDIKDDVFPGLEFVIDFLARLSDHELVWRYVDWALQKDPELSVRIFTDRSDDEMVSERMRPDTIIDYLHAYPKAVVRYLEYLVFTKKLEKEKYHTHLAVLYLDNVLRLRQDVNTPKNEMDLARSTLRHMLQESSIYRVQLILGKVKETDMYPECAILYGKLEEHDKALRLLVHKLQDYGAAENYCIINSKGRDRSYRRRLFQILLGVYLDPMEGKRDSLVRPAMDLLNSEDADFDSARVLQIVPENWSIGLLSQFLHNSVRNSIHTSRMSKLEHSLSRGSNLKNKKEKYHTHLAVLYLDNVLRLRQDVNTPKNEMDLARSTLRHMLQESSIYRVQLILGKVKEIDMYPECAILYGKLEEHDKALRLLVRKLQDYGAAENYCIINSKGRDRSYRRRLFQILLGVYLDPMEGKRDSLVRPAMDLLNSEDADFDSARVLQIVPENWSIGLLSQFLHNSVRNSIHTSRMSKLEHSLSRGSNLKNKVLMMEEQKAPIYITEERLCQVCNRPFTDPIFVRYPNGVITHTQCARNKAVCPITGKLFSTTKGH